MKQLLLSVYDCCCEQSSLVIEDGECASECKRRNFDWDDICFLHAKKEGWKYYYFEDEEEEIKERQKKFSEYDEIILCEDGEISIIKKEDLI